MKPIPLVLLGFVGTACGYGEALSAPPASPDLSKWYVFYLHGAICGAIAEFALGTHTRAYYLFPSLPWGGCLGTLAIAIRLVTGL